MRTILLAVALMAAVAVSAQEISPVHTEVKIKKSVKGEFTVVNNGVTPMPVTIQVMELKGNVNGQPQFVAVPGDVHVELKDTSAVVGPKSNRTFEFKVTSDRPVALGFFAGMTASHAKVKNASGDETTTAIQVKIWMPSVWYFCTDKVSGCRVRMKQEMGITE